MAEILQAAEVTNTYAWLKFLKTIQVASIDAATIVLATDEATPQNISSPFLDYTAENNYNSISRSLKLYWAPDALTANTDYTLTISGLIDVAGNSLDDGYIEFTTGDSVVQDDTQLPDTTLGEPEIVDYSIITPPAINNSSLTVNDNPEFYLLESDPVDGDYFVEQDYELGRLKLVFSSTPDVAFMKSEYIKVQRKKNQIAPGRWESIIPEISISSSHPWVYLDFPAIEDDSIYHESGYTYFEEDYTYRVKLSRYIKAA